MSWSFSVSSNTPFSMSTSVNAPASAVSLHTQQPSFVMPPHAHSPMPATFSQPLLQPTSPPPSIHGMDVAHYHSLIHAELMYLQQQQDANLRMQQALHYQMQLANAASSPPLAPLASPSPVPLVHSPHPHSQLQYAAFPSPAAPFPHSFRPPSLHWPASSPPSPLPPSPLPQSALSPPQQHSTHSFITSPRAHRSSSRQLSSYPAALTNALANAQPPQAASQHSAAAHSHLTASSNHQPPHPHAYHHHSASSVQPPWSPASPSPTNPASHYAPSPSIPHYYPFPSLTHPHVHSHPHPMPHLPYQPPPHSHSHAHAHAHAHAHSHSHSHSHSHLHPYARPMPSYHSAARGLVLHPHPMAPFQPLFSSLSMPGLPVHVPAHAHQHEDNKRAASAAAVQSLQRQLIERKLTASIPTISCADGETVNESDDVKTCAVCLCDFEHGEMSLLMPCSHPYHESCLLPWLSRHNTCPSCRYEVMTDDELYNRTVRIKQERQRLEKERRMQRMRSPPADSATQPTEASGEAVAAPPAEESSVVELRDDDDEEEEDDEDDEDTMYDDSEVDDEDDEYYDEDEEEDDDVDVITVDDDSDVVEIQPPHLTAHNRTNPIVIDADDDDYKHSGNDLSLASYPSIPSLPSNATTLSAWSSNQSTESLPLSMPVVPIASVVMCGLCGHGCGNGGVDDVLCTSCCGVTCHNSCVQRVMVGAYAGGASEWTCPVCRLPAPLSSVA